MSKRLILASVILSLLVMACNNISKHGENGESDRNDVENISKPDTIQLPDTTYASIENINWTVEIIDESTPEKIKDLTNPYDTVDGSLTFRGNSRRDARYNATIKGTPSRIVQDWMFETTFDNTATKTGTWGGGSGWTGQPIYINWTDAQVAEFKAKSPGLTDNFGNKEIILGSLCGQAYFINFETGKQSRKSIEVGNPIKGSASLDPALNGSLYIGQGIPAHEEIGCLAIDLYTHQRVFKYGIDPKAGRHWGAYDSSPVVVGDFLFWPGENGTFYKYTRQGNGSLKIHSKLRYTVRGSAPGIENSLCVYKNYGYFGDNHGNILCVNLNTMKPVWYYDNHDDIDASIVLEIENDTPVLYCGSEVDQQGEHGNCYMIKLNALNGSLMWEQKIECRKLNMDGKHFDGGLYSTPLLGTGDCSDLLFANICQRGNSGHAEFTAFNKKNGEIVYRTPLKYFAWTSPVSFINENNELFIFTGDSSGNAYLIKGKTGEIIFTERMGNNFESTPVVVDNHLVVGSRGHEIYRFSIE